MAKSAPVIDPPVTESGDDLLPDEPAAGEPGAVFDEQPDTDDAAGAEPPEEEPAAASDEAPEPPHQPIDPAGYQPYFQIRTGGTGYAMTPCPICAIPMVFAVETGAEIKVSDDGTRKLKPTFKVKAKEHRCGQTVLPITDDEAPGQTEAFAESGPSNEALTAAAVGLLLDQVADILPDDVSIEFPADEGMEAWTAEQLAEVAAWARAVVEAQDTYPDIPEVLRPVAAAPIDDLGD
jgi:hypothetical protein